MQVLGHDQARAWFGEAREATVFQWHHEAFELPPGTVPLATSDACPHQAFAIGRHDLLYARWLGLPKSA